MPKISVFKATKPKSTSPVKQTYYVCALEVIWYKDGEIKLAYGVPNGTTNVLPIRKTDEKTKVFFKKMVKLQGRYKKEKKK